MAAETQVGRPRSSPNPEAPIENCARYDDSPGGKTPISGQFRGIADILNLRTQIVARDPAKSGIGGKDRTDRRNQERSQPWQ